AFGIPASIREIQRVNETRNILILSRVTNIPTMPPGPGRCTKCAMLTQCQRISSILYWQPPEPDPQVMAARQLIAASEVTQPHSHMTSLQSAVSDTSEDRDFFARYYRLL